ncbi:MAG: DNA-methyltransferase [Promethearchaeota archaeon]
MKTTHTLILGNAKKELSRIKDGSVHLIITSPPYWYRKNYNNKEQIGFGQTYKEYLQDLFQVLKECFRILVPGRKLCINIGDVYLDSKTHGRYSVLSIKTDIIKYCVGKLGLIYHGAIIWQKICKTKPSGGVNGRFMGSYPYPPNGIITIDYEYILIFKKPGASKKVSKELKEKSKIPKKKWETYFNGHWIISGDKTKDHPATFPLEIPTRLIRMYSFQGEIVLDPFLGSGTTMLAARNLQRNSIGIELNKTDYWPTIKKKVGFKQQDLFQECKFIVKEAHL